MAKRGKTTRSKPVPTGDGPTPERQARDDWQKVDAPRMAGERWNAKAQPPHVMRRLARGQRLVKLGWVSEREGQILETYEDMMDKAGFGHRRSCLDRTPPANDRDGAPAYILDTRRRLANVRNAVPGVALMTLDALLFPADEFGPETVDEVAKRLFPGAGEKRRMVDLRAQIEVAARALLAKLGGPKRLTVAG